VGRVVVSDHQDGPNERDIFSRVFQTNVSLQWIHICCLSFCVSNFSLFFCVSSCIFCSLFSLFFEFSSAKFSYANSFCDLF